MKQQFFGNKKDRCDKESFKDKRAVSPVIGVILMVAIVVILAAVIAAFVFGLTPRTEIAPYSSLAVKVSAKSPDPIQIKHSSGDPIVLADTSVIVTPDISDPGTMTACGAMTEITSIGSTATLDVGEVGGVTTEPTTLVEGNTARVKVIHVPTGQMMVDIRALVRA